MYIFTICQLSIFTYCMYKNILHTVCMQNVFEFRFKQLKNKWMQQIQIKTLCPPMGMPPLFTFVDDDSLYFGYAVERGFFYFQFKIIKEINLQKQIKAIFNQKYRVWLIFLGLYKLSLCFQINSLKNLWFDLRLNLSPLKDLKLTFSFFMIN